MPPSHSSAQERPRSAIQPRSVSILGIMSAINFCPPKPGSTVITSTMSSSSSHGSTASAAVAGLSATAAIFPAARMAAMAALTSSGVSASACTVTRSAPASQKRRAYRTGFSIMRWTSRNMSVAFRTEASTGRPMEMFGTNTPSITSK